MSEEKEKKKWFKKVVALLYLMLNDIFFLIGAAFILVATYRYSLNIGLMLTGVFFMLYSYLLSKQRR